MCGREGQARDHKNEGESGRRGIIEMWEIVAGGRRGIKQMRERVAGK